MSPATESLRLAASLGLALALGCSQPGTDADREPAAGAPVAGGPALYVARAEVVGLPDAGDPGTGLTVHHEAIEGLRSVDGEVWGMDAMTMEFPVAEGLSLEGIGVGDKVELTLAVDWLAVVPQRIVEVRELPGDTELVFQAAKPPGE